MWRRAPSADGHKPGGGEGSLATLVVGDLHAGYGAMEVVHGVSFELSAGEIVVFVGRNGAGKTTIAHAVAGLRAGRSRGSVRLDGRELLGHSAAEIARLGVALVPAGHRIFGGLSVAENLKLGAFAGRGRLGRGELDRRLTEVRQLFPVLESYAHRDAGHLSGGEQQMLAIGQSLMSAPRLLLLDEPTSGLAPPIVRTIAAALENLRQEGFGILLIEQDVKRGLQLSDRCYVIDQGRVVMSGPSAALESDPRVEAVVAGLAWSAE